MKKHLSNKNGITLVELLAVIVIGSIVMTLIISIFSTGQKQYSSQTTQAEQLNDVRYAAKVITKEIRMAEKIKWDGSRLLIGTDSPLSIKEGKDTIIKDGKVFVTNITVTFLSSKEVSINERKVIFELKSTDDNREKPTEISTEIYIREGVTIE